MRSSARENLQKYVSNPKHKGLTEEQLSKSFDSSIAGCEDYFNIYIETNGDKVTIAKWEGAGCAISAGSVEALLDLIQGKEINEVNTILDSYETFISGENDKINKELEVFDIVRTHISRKKCALVALKPIREGIK